jgi:transposase InsO family protein
MTRQNYYKRKTLRRHREVDEGFLVSLVRRERRYQPRLGVRKLYLLLREELVKAGVKVGRDRMFRILRCMGLLVPPLPRSPRTTDSYHSLPVFLNEIKGVEPMGPGEIWVSDMTYIRTMGGFIYLSVIMDLYSRKIVGYHASSNLEAEGCITALEMAVEDLEDGRYPIHHSDRGCQYCCHEYVARLMGRGMKISMTQENHCYENAHVERLHGILKQEYGLGGTFRTREQAKRAIDQAVWMYNTRRPHGGLGNRVPQEVHDNAA